MKVVIIIRLNDYKARTVFAHSNAEAGDSNPSRGMDVCIYYLFVALCVGRDRLCGLVGRVPGYRYRGPGFDSRNYYILWEVVGLERGPLSLVSNIEELLGRKSSGSGLENQ
jgi:hypothetical protein